MKKQLLFLITLFSFQLLFSQVCVKQATLKDGLYTIDGTVTFADSSGDLKLVLESDFVSQSGPDVQVFLTNDSVFNQDMDKVTLLNTFSGKQVFDLNDSILLSDYKSVVFICVRFGNLLWGYGNFNDPQGNCATSVSDVSSIEKSWELEGNVVQVYKENIEISVSNFSGILLDKFVKEGSYLLESGGYIISDGSRSVKVFID